MRFNPAIFCLLLIVKTGCGINNHEIISPDFTANILAYPFDTTVNKIAWYNNYLVCALDNGKLAILDSNYVRQTTLEEKVNQRQSDYMFVGSDSLFLCYGKRIYYLDKDFETVPYARDEFFQREAIYEDSVYHVSECCVGEFGGSVFFRDKNTDRVFSYPATCAVQVLRTNDGYLVCTNLAHLSYSTGHFLVKDPSLLYELTVDSQRRHCNWWVIVDSLYDYSERELLPGVLPVLESNSGMTLMNFTFKDSTYAIITRDSGVYVNVLRDSAFFVVDTLLKHSLNFHNTQVIQAWGNTISLINLTRGSPFAAYFVRGSASALVVVKGTGIDFLLPGINSLKQQR